MPLPADNAGTTACKLTTAVESFIKTLDELKPLFELHYDMLALDQDRVPLDPQYDVYAAHEAAGELSFVALRADGALVGYWVSFVCPALHYAGCKTAQMDMWFIHPGHAGGTAPLRLIRAVEAELRRRSVQRWSATEKLHTPCGRLFEAVGMEKVEATYAKWIGD